MKIRRYKPGEEKEIWKLFYNTVHCINSRDYTPKQISAWAPDNQDMTKWTERLVSKNPFVAIIDSEIAGFAELEKNGHIDCFYCAYTWQRKGVGSALLKHIENEARLMNIQKLFTEASITAVLFFEKSGFSTIKENRVELRGVEFSNFLMEKLICS